MTAQPGSELEARNEARNYLLRYEGRNRYLKRMQARLKRQRFWIPSTEEAASILKWKSRNWKLPPLAPGLDPTPRILFALLDESDEFDGDLADLHAELRARSPSRERYFMAVSEVDFAVRLNRLRQFLISYGFHYSPSEFEAGERVHIWRRATL